MKRAACAARFHSVHSQWLEPQRHMPTTKAIRLPNGLVIQSTTRSQGFPAMPVPLIKRNEQSQAPDSVQFRPLPTAGATTTHASHQERIVKTRSKPPVLLRQRRYSGRTADTTASCNQGRWSAKTPPRNVRAQMFPAFASSHDRREFSCRRRKWAAGRSTF